MICHGNDEINFLSKLLLTNRQFQIFVGIYEYFVR